MRIRSKLKGNAINSVARSCGVRIETYTAGAAAPTPPPAPPASGGAAATGDTLPPGTTASTLEITAEGTYASMTRFFQRLETYPRLINVSQVSMQTKQYPLLTTKFRLSRYTGLSPESAAL